MISNDELFTIPNITRVSIIIVCPNRLSGYVISRIGNLRKGKSLVFNEI
jgi:hypothetical protein